MARMFAIGKKEYAKMIYTITKVTKSLNYNLQCRTGTNISIRLFYH